MKDILTVFLCGTYTDLAEERKQILRAIELHQLQPDSMELFGARSNQAIETCLDEVRKSDLLVVVVGHRYGTLIPNNDLSFSEAEYREGYSLRKICLVYIRSDDAPIPAKFYERLPENMDRLKRWKSTLRERHTVAEFFDANDLALRVSSDLSKTVQSLREVQVKARENKAEAPSSFDSLMAEVSAMLQMALDEGIAEDRLLLTLRRAVTSMLGGESGQPPTVFFSYSHNDKPIVLEVTNQFQLAGIKVWLDLSKIHFGDNIRERIDQGFDSADFIVVFISRSSVEKQWARLELNMIIARKLSGSSRARVLPVLLEDVEIPPVLRDIRYVDLRDHDVKSKAREMIDSIRSYYGPWKPENNAS